MIEDIPTVERTQQLQDAVDYTIEKIRELRANLDSLDKDIIDTRLYWILCNIKKTTKDSE